MALAGKLTSQAILSALEEIERRRASGVLEATTPGSQVVAHFWEGCLVRAELGGQGAEGSLAALVVRSGAAPGPAVGGVQQRWEPSQGPFPAALALAGVLSHQDAASLAALQTTDAFYRIFEWGRGEYRFDDGTDAVRTLGIDPVPAERLAADGRRMVDEWPRIRGRVSDDQRTFGKRKVIDDQTDAGALGPTEMLVYTLVGDGRSVRDIEDLSRLGRFETRRALYQLLESGHIGGASMTSSGQQAEDAPSTALVRRRKLVHAATSFLLMVLVLGVAVAAARHRLAGRRGSAGGLARDAQVALQSELARYQEARLRSVLRVYRLHHGAYPEALDQVVAAGLLRPGDLRFPGFEQPYAYRRKGDRSFDLMPPLR